MDRTYNNYIKNEKQEDQLLEGLNIDLVRKQCNFSQSYLPWTENARCNSELFDDVLRNPELKKKTGRKDKIQS